MKSHNIKLYISGPVLPHAFLPDEHKDRWPEVEIPPLRHGEREMSASSHETIEDAIDAAISNEIEYLPFDPNISKEFYYDFLKESENIRAECKRLACDKLNIDLYKEIQKIFGKDFDDWPEGTAVLFVAVIRYFLVY